MRKPAGQTLEKFSSERRCIDETPRWPASWHGFRLTRRKNGLRNRRRLLGGVYATRKDQEPRAAAARSRPGRAGMAPGCPWNMVTVAGFVASSLVLIGRPRYFGGKIARIAALAFSHKLTAVSYNIGAPGAPKCPESTRRLGHCPTGPALPGAIARYRRPS